MVVLLEAVLAGKAGSKTLDFKLTRDLTILLGIGDFFRESLKIHHKKNPCLLFCSDRAAPKAFF